MSTRGTIAVQHADGTVSQIYSHYDNYLEGTGQTLLDCYNTLEQAEALVSGGDISSIGKNVERTEYYGRDRGDEGCEPYRFTSLDSYYQGLCGQEYNYLFNDGQWWVEYYDCDGGFVNLAKALKFA